MGANLTAKRLLVGLIVTFLLTGCAAAATPSPPATAAATTSVAVATRTPTPTPTPAPEPSTPLGPPAAPTGATYHGDRFTGLKDVTVTAAWSEASPNGVSIWVYAVTECLAPAGSSRVDCVTEGSKIPASALVVLRKVPAAAGTTAWTFTDYNIGGALGVYGSVEYYAIILRAVSKAGQSPFVVAGTAQSCYQCTY